VWARLLGVKGVIVEEGAAEEDDRTRWDDRKLDHVRPYLESAQAAGRYGVVAIVAAQEFQWVVCLTPIIHATAGRAAETAPGWSES
jgi:hypothetical protein